jgi:hypothetical protein
MYINDIAEKLISPTRLFADYTYFSYSNRDELQIKTVIDHDLEELDEWSKKWLMTFNSDKTEIMLFSNTDIPELNLISLIYIINNRGPSTDPWGTPAEALQSEEDDLFINTLCCRSCR